jgi:hypothetical protein
MPAKEKQLHITDAKQLEKISFAGRVLAELRGVTSRAVERGADPDDENYIGIKKVEHGKYEARHSLFVMFRDLVRQVDEAKRSNSNARELNLQLDAQKKEMELAEKQKELIKVDDVVTMFEKILTSSTSKTTASRKLAAPKLLLAKDDKEVNLILEKRDNELTNDLTTTITNILQSMAESAGKDYTNTRTVKAKSRRKPK